MNVSAKALLTAREVANRIGVSLRTVWRWNSIGELPAPVRRGRVVRWKTADIDLYVQELPVQRSRYDPLHQEDAESDRVISIERASSRSVTV